MYHSDHLPPHFHVIYGSRRAMIAIERAAVLEGSLPPRQLRLVLRWSRQHRAELSANWERARRSEPLHSIRPPD
jgi:hypothetical protein